MSELTRYKNYKTILSVHVMIFCGDEALFMKRSVKKETDPGKYHGVGGKVEPGESFYDAILREIREETGIEKLESIRPYAITQSPDTKARAEWVIVEYVAKIGKKIKLAPTGDGEFVWADPLSIGKDQMVADLYDHLLILRDHPDAFMSTCMKVDKDNKLTEMKINVY